MCFCTLLQQFFFSFCIRLIRNFLKHDFLPWFHHILWSYLLCNKLSKSCLVSEVSPRSDVSRETRDEQVNHYVCLFNKLNYPYLYSVRGGLEQGAGGAWTTKGRTNQKLWVRRQMRNSLWLCRNVNHILRHLDAMRWELDMEVNGVVVGRKDFAANNICQQHRGEQMWNCCQQHDWSYD